MPMAENGPSKDAKPQEEQQQMQPVRHPFGELTNEQFAPGPEQTEMPEMFFGVSKPFFSNTYKKREKKLMTKKTQAKSKVDQENKKDKKFSEADAKKEKGKSRCQKNNEQKMALQVEF